MGFAVLSDKPARVQRHVSMRVPVRGGTQMASVPGEQVKGRVTWPRSSHRTQDASLTAADSGTCTMRVERERCTQERLAASVQTFTLFARTLGGGGAGVGSRAGSSGIAVVMDCSVLVQGGGFRAL